MSPPDLVLLAYQVVERLTAHYTARLAELGLTRAEAKVLLVLEPGRQVLVSKVAERMWADRSNTTQLITRLTRRGLIERQPGEVAGLGDRRTRIVSLTPAGESLRETLMARTETGNPIYADLSDAELRTLHTLLDRIERHAASRAPG